jgi:alpha-tectorin
MIPTTLVEMTDGLCANNNGDASDDLITRWGVDVTNHTDAWWEFGQSWQVVDEEDVG